MISVVRAAVAALAIATLVACTSSGAGSSAQTATDNVQDVHGLPGLGALVSEWNQKHSPVPGAKEGTAYGPMIGDQPEYSGVDEEEDHVWMYTVSFDEGTTLEVAERAIWENEFPSDAKETATHDRGDDCVIFGVQSTSVYRALGLDPTAYNVTVGFYSDSDFLDRNSVTNVSVIAGAPADGATC